MTYQEKKTIMSMASGLLIFIGYSAYLYAHYYLRMISDPVDFKFWGAAILIMIPVSIVARIIIHILFAIFDHIATREPFPSFTDERDKIIELRALRASHYVFTFGFLIAMASLVIDIPHFWMFVILVVSGLLSELVSGFTQLFYYRRGF